MRDEIGEISLVTELLESRLIIDQGSYDLSILWDTRLFDEDEIPIIDPLLIHRVSLCPEKKILLGSRDESGRYWDLCLDIFVGKYRHPASDRPDEWDHPDLMTI
jgi:WD40 repeat protein